MDCCVVNTEREGACQACRPAGDLLHPDPRVRRRALERAAPEDRPRVLLAFLRGGSLFEGVRVDGEDLGLAIVTWLLTHRCPTLFRRWLAEDAVWGGHAWEELAREEPQRVLQRSPDWLAGERPAAEHAPSLARAWGHSPEPWTTLGFRLGSATGRATLPPHLMDAFPTSARFWVQRGLDGGAWRPSHKGWVPDASQLQAARRWRRWPLRRLTPTGLLVCTLCAEPLPAEGICLWCGTDPEQEPPTDLSVHDLLTQRFCCTVCGLDLTRRASPVRCGGCGAHASS